MSLVHRGGNGVVYEPKEFETYDILRRQGRFSRTKEKTELKIDFSPRVQVYTTCAAVPA